MRVNRKEEICVFSHLYITGELLRRFIENWETANKFEKIKIWLSGDMPNPLIHHIYKSTLETIKNTRKKEKGHGMKKL